MFATVAAHIPKATVTEASLTGRRYSAEEAVAAGIAVAARPEAEVLPTAVARAASMAGKNREVLKAHKQLLYGDAIAVCFHS